MLITPQTLLSRVKKSPSVDAACLMSLVTCRSCSVDSRDRDRRWPADRRTGLWLAGWAGTLAERRKWRMRSDHPGTLWLFTEETVSCMQPAAVSAATYTRAAGRRAAESWRPCPCRLSGTVCTGRPSSATRCTVCTTGSSRPARGDGVSAQWHTERVKYCQPSRATQHVCPAAAAPLQMDRTWHRGCGLFTTRPRGRLQVRTCQHTIQHEAWYSNSGVMTNVSGTLVHTPIDTGSHYFPCSQLIL